MPSPQAPRPLRVMVYSDDLTVRRAVITALGTRPDPDLPELEFVEVATGPVVLRTADAGGLALMILDGEADPDRRPRADPPAQGRDPPLPAHPRAHRTTAGRLVGHVVARRCGGGPPDRPGPAGRGRRPALLRTRLPATTRP